MVINQPSSESWLPITEVLARANCLTSERKIRRDEALFCSQTALWTIEACLNQNYHYFDGHTATQCCHGIALLVRDLLLRVPREELDALYRLGKSKLLAYKELAEDDTICPGSIWRIPEVLIDLTVLYIIAFSSEIDDHNGRRVVPLRLRSIAKLGRKVCGRITRRLQREMSNRVASRYQELVAAPVFVAGISMAQWGKYVASDYLREDSEGRLYTSHLYSMQVTLGHLIATQSKAVILNDLVSKDNEDNGRYLQVLQGDGKGQLVPTVLEEGEADSEPVIVFAGCCYSDTLTADGLSRQMERWEHKFDRLILACETHCDQFPDVKLDPNFDSSPIVPLEENTNDLLARYASIKGVSVTNSSLFCLFHVYVASLKQVKGALIRPEVLPNLRISRRLRGVPKGMMKKDEPIPLAKCG